MVDEVIASVGLPASVEALLPAEEPYIQVAVPSPLRRLFDYLRPVADSDLATPLYRGQRVSVPFGRRTVIGIVVASTAITEVPADKLKPIAGVLDDGPLLPPDLMQLLLWASRYYQHPLGDALTSALPVNLRKGALAQLQAIERYQLLAPSPEACDTRRSPMQARLLEAMHAAGSSGLGASDLSQLSASWRSAVKSMCSKGWVGVTEELVVPQNLATAAAPPLLDGQQAAIDAVKQSFGQHQAHLLNGVTGSGKTEVYLQVIDAVSATSAGAQVLVLVPEISLTPQLLQRFSTRIDGCIVSLHSGLNDTERMQNWLLASTGRANVVIGTRSAVFTPMPHLALIIIDEEHDSSLKQQDGFRYHARDLAMMRARDRQLPVLLGSATPSFESLNNVAVNRYRESRLLQRAGNAQSPQVSLLDIRRRRLTEGLSDRLLKLIQTHLDSDGQIMVFLNRRGFAPTLLCNDCGAATGCEYCDANMTVHARGRFIRCHHCGAERTMPDGCATCGSTSLDSVGQGTERIELALQEAFPEVTIARIDRDSTRRKGSLERHLEEAVSGRARILVGTQMLAKGHHFPGVTLVAILDADRGLYGTDYRALEQTAQLIVQVAGRAGRAEKRGEVLIQTRNPDNPLLQLLVSEGYQAFAGVAMQERQAAMLPPYSHVALIRAESRQREQAHQFLAEVASVLQAGLMQLQAVVAGTRQAALAPSGAGGVSHSNPDSTGSAGTNSVAGGPAARAPTPSIVWFGPVPSPMERIGERFRAQVLVQATTRRELHHALQQVVDTFDAAESARRVRWSIDVDPVDFF